MDGAFNPSTISNDDDQRTNNPMYHICHVCHDYRSSRKSDIKRHFEKQKTCTKKFMSYETSKHFTIEEAIKRTFNVRYIIPFDVSNLCRIDYLYIITHYKDPLNIVEYAKVIANRNVLGLNDLPKIPVPATTVVTSNKYGNNSHKKINDNQIPSCGLRLLDISVSNPVKTQPSWLPEREQKVAGSRQQSMVNRNPSSKKVSWLIPDEDDDDDDDDDEDVILMALPSKEQKVDDWPPPAVDMSLLLCARSSDRANRVDQLSTTFLAPHRGAEVCCDMSRDMSTISGSQSSSSTKTVDQPQMDVKSNKKFQCPSCLTVYNYKKDLINLAKNPTLCMNRQWFNKAQIKNDVTTTHTSNMIPDVSSKYVDIKSMIKQVNNP